MAAEATQDALAGRSPAWTGLCEVLAHETRGLEEFTGVLERQRQAIGTGDRATLEATVEDLDRLLLRLAKLCEQRQHMVDGLAHVPGETLAELLERLAHADGGRSPAAGAEAPFQRAHRALRHAVENAARASRVNGVVLRRVLDSERAFLQSLFSEGPVVGYPGAPTAPAAGLLCDRQG